MLQVVNISLKNPIMPKEFYWNHLKIDDFNKMLSYIYSNESKTFEMHIPQMPLNSQPFNITFILKNLSISKERELKIFKRVTCDCSSMQNKKRKECQDRPKCPHKSIASLRPASANIKCGSLMELELIWKYELVGQHDVSFHISSSNYIVKLKLIAITTEFDPITMLLTNKLTPEAINCISVPQQALWFHNPYASDIEIKFVSYDASLSFINNEAIIKSQNHFPVFVIFRPSYIGRYAMKIGIIFNECECSTEIHADCTACNSFYECAWLLAHNSPNDDIPSQLNPFVIHGDNLCIVTPPNGISNENLIGLQNSSKHCIKYEWVRFDSLDLPFDIIIYPQNGYLKAGFTKLFHVTVKGGSRALQVQQIPLRCKIWLHDSETFREYLISDGYFEYTDDGYYEKPQNLPQNCLEHTHTLCVNTNIKVLSYNDASKILSSKSDDNRNLLHYTQLYNEENCNVKVMQALVSTKSKGDPACCCFGLQANGNENYTMEIIIRRSFNRLKYVKNMIQNWSFKERFSCDKTFISNVKENEENNFKRLLQIMNEILFENISEISKEHRFISSSW